MKLSFCMIVKNEAENLPRCLESVKDAVDELIVLDTGSTDATVAIARSFGAQVYHFPWNNSFSDARNEALQYITGDWILVLDADEVLAPEIISTLRQVIQQEQAIVVNLIRHEIGATQSPYSLVSRLFRNHPAIRFSRPYHAMVDDSVAQLMTQEPHWQVINCSDVAILHYGYEPGAIASHNKLEKARTTMEGFFADHPDDAYVCSKLGALYVQMDDWARGVELLQRGLKLPSNPPVRYELHYHLGIAQSRLQNYPQAERHYHLAIAQPLLESLKLGAYNNLGSLLQAKGDLAGAKALFEKALAIDPAFAAGHYNLGMNLKALGQMVEAIAHYQQAIILNPSYAEAYQNLGVVLLKLGRVPEGLEAFEKAIALHDQQNSLEGDRLRQGLQQMGFSLN
ncbi:MAG: tetratricopeptide repeat protein [Drouetiella hepatica Uher 2000/2452]|jgi:glycosyltransferase involved in cell wall biosynthesis|uniref:Tetratricopeptide repeat protein n=1 Tax=Drouetiella hepatica Uher 2000/2452 TaxID=904376 RepID=A0A951QDU6_9CYAN|nr:tetratricopeptide repeat protein [Drouetiella hepatica Uher 2000/2452]